MRGVLLHSPPATLQGFEQHEVMKPSPVRDAFQVGSMALTIIGSFMLFGMGWHQGYVTYTQAGIFVLLVLITIATLHVSSRLPRHCVFCGDELARIYHHEQDSGGRGWHGTIFVCKRCRKYESHLALDD